MADGPGDAAFCSVRLFISRLRCVCDARPGGVAGLDWTGWTGLDGTEIGRRCTCGHTCTLLCALGRYASPGALAMIPRNLSTESFCPSLSLSTGPRTSSHLCVLRAFNLLTRRRLPGERHVERGERQAFVWTGPVALRWNSVQHDREGRRLAARAVWARRRWDDVAAGERERGVDGWMEEEREGRRERERRRVGM